MQGQHTITGHLHMLLRAFELHATCWLLQVLFFFICIVMNADLTHNRRSFACSLDVLKLHATCCLIHTLIIFSSTN